MFENFRDLLEIDDLCLALGVGKNRAYTLVNSGEIKSFKIGKVHKIPKINVIKYIKNHK